MWFIQIRVEDKVAELKRMDLAVARLVDVLTKKVHFAIWRKSAHEVVIVGRLWN